jgi:hypothetical protein
VKEKFPMDQCIRPGAFLFFSHLDSIIQLHTAYGTSFCFWLNFV